LLFAKLAFAMQDFARFLESGSDPTLDNLRRLAEEIAAEERSTCKDLQATHAMVRNAPQDFCLKALG
jgi:hypothetical protein